MPAASTLTIGAVVTALADEFDDISISKVRYLEAEGLVTPQRTASGYRLFSADDVERLRYVLRAQRDRFLPLKVIRDELDAIERGVVAPHTDLDDTPSEPEGMPPGVPTVPDLTRPVRMRMTTAELAARVGLTTVQVESLAGYGLVSPDPDGYHDEDDLTVAAAAASLVRFGIEPRHLRPFRSAADREATLVQYAVAQQGLGVPDPDVESEPRAEAAAEVARQCLALHVALVRQALRGE